MDKYVDLTEDRAFSKRRIRKSLTEGRTPWDTQSPIVRLAAAFRYIRHDVTICARCGSDIRRLPWTIQYDLCERCERIIDTSTHLPWKDCGIKDGYRDVFLSEFMDVRRLHL